MSLILREVLPISLVFVISGNKSPLKLMSPLTSIPSIKTRATYPGCIRSFTGYPFGGTGDFTAPVLSLTVTDSTASLNWNSVVSAENYLVYQDSTFLIEDSDTAVDLLLRTDKSDESPAVVIPARTAARPEIRASL